MAEGHSQLTLAVWFEPQAMIPAAVLWWTHEIEATDDCTDSWRECLCIYSCKHCPISAWFKQGWLVGLPLLSWLPSLALLQQPCVNVNGQVTPVSSCEWSWWWKNSVSLIRHGALLALSRISATHVCERQSLSWTNALSWSALSNRSGRLNINYVCSASSLSSWPSTARSLILSDSNVVVFCTSGLLCASNSSLSSPNDWMRDLVPSSFPHGNLCQGCPETSLGFHFLA